MWSSVVVDPPPLLAVTLWMVDIEIPADKGSEDLTAAALGTRLGRLGVAPDALHSSSVTQIEECF